MEFGLLAQALIAVAVLYGVLWFEARRGNAADCTRDLWDTAIAAGVVGLLVGRLAAMLIAGTNPVARPADVMIIRGGVDTVWASIGALATLAALTRSEFLAVADGLSAAVLASLAGWHAACLVTETCLGTPSDLPWAVSLAGSSVTRHPVEIYAALLYAAAAVGVMVWRRRHPPIGTLAFAGLALAGAVRLATEPMRPTIASGPGWSYAVAVLIGVAGVAILRLRRPARLPNDYPE